MMFNKITKEEAEKYKELSTAMFTCLPPMHFNWDVRHAIGLLKIPELLENNTDFGKAVYQLADYLFQEYHTQLSSFADELLLIQKNKLESELERVRSSLSDLNTQIKRIPFASAIYAFTFSAGIIGCFYLVNMVLNNINPELFTAMR